MGRREVMVLAAAAKAKAVAVTAAKRMSVVSVSAVVAAATVCVGGEKGEGLLQGTYRCPHVAPAGRNRQEADLMVPHDSVSRRC